MTSKLLTPLTEVILVRIQEGITISQDACFAQIACSAYQKGKTLKNEKFGEAKFQAQYILQNGYGSDSLEDFIFWEPSRHKNCFQWELEGN